VTWGRYRLDVASDDRSIPPTSVTFDAGFYSDASADTPDLLEIALDKPEYAAGDTMTVAVTARTPARSRSTWSATKLFSTTTTDVQAGTARIPLTVGRDWGTGAYVVATLRRPLDEAASRMPGRAIGLQWFSVDKKARTLAFELPLPTLMRPEGPHAGGRSSCRGLQQPARRRGRPVAAVDCRHRQPHHTTSRPRRLTLSRPAPASPAEFAILYGKLLDGKQGLRAARLRTGVDAGGPALGGIAADSKPPLASIPASSTVNRTAGRGPVRLSAFCRHRYCVMRSHVERTRSARPQATSRCAIRSCSPRRCRASCSPAIAARSGLDLDNVEGPAGDYAINVQTFGPLQVGQARKTVKLAGKQRTGVSLPINATQSASAMWR
jgi:hypothetical protein